MPHFGLISLAKIRNLKSIFDKYRLRWMDKTSESYNTEVVHEFYASYSASIYLIIQVVKTNHYWPMY